MDEDLCGGNGEGVGEGEEGEGGGGCWVCCGVGLFGGGGGLENAEGFCCGRDGWGC